jgi:hypothetical protein
MKRCGWENGRRSSDHLADASALIEVSSALTLEISGSLLGLEAIRMTSFPVTATQGFIEVYGIATRFTTPLRDQVAR